MNCANSPGCIQAESVTDIGCKLEATALYLILDGLLTIIQSRSTTVGKSAALLQIQVHVAASPAKTVETHDFVAEDQQGRGWPWAGVIVQPIDMQLNAISDGIRSHLTDVWTSESRGQRQQPCGKAANGHGD
jgi:hypothetical protein